MLRGNLAARAPAWLPRSWTFVRRFVAESEENRLLAFTAEIAFFAVLSIFPGLLLAAGLLGVLDEFLGDDVATGAKRTIVTALDLVFAREASGVVTSVRNLFENGRGGVLTFATSAALLTLSGAFAIVINALDISYHVGEQRSWIRRRLLGLVLGLATMVMVVLALTVLVVGPFLGRGETLAELVGLGAAWGFVWNVLRFPVLFFALVGWAAALFHYAPNRRGPWRESLPGAYTTAVLWILASLGFHLYLRLVAGANPVLGAFGGGVIVMIWVYLLSLTLLVGGQLNATLRAE